MNPGISLYQPVSSLEGKSPDPLRYKVGTS